MPRKPLTLLLIAVALITFLIQSGEMGTSDTDHRLQVAHSWWTGDLEVAPQEYPDFGLHGRHGKLYAWYGIGQSLILFPLDIAGTKLEKLPAFRNYADSGADPTIRTIFVSILLNVFLNVVTAYVAYQLLLLMAFTPGQSTLGTLALLCATTHFYYAQNMQENNYIFLLTLIGIYGQSRWALAEIAGRGDLACFDPHARRALLIGSAALGLNLLTRLTTGLDLLASGVIVLLLLSTLARRDGSASFLRGLKRYIVTAAPVYVLFFLCDRAYQFYRFGSWTNTYVSIFAADQRRLDPSLPATFPFNGHWFQGGLSSGILGPLFSPAKSIFFFDPLLILTIVLLFVLWKRLPPLVRSLGVSALLLVAAYIVFYARYFWWSGDFSWGDRYVSSAVELACFLGVPLLAHHWRGIPALLRRLGATLALASLALQLISIAFWLPLEVYQANGRYPLFIQGMRIRNVAAQFIVQFGAPRPAWAPPIPVIDDAWDLLHITCWNLLPSLLRHTGEAPMGVVYMVWSVWIFAAVILLFVLIRLMRSLMPQPA